MREAVPFNLRDVVILDASTPIRLLVDKDRTVSTEDSIPPEELKSFENLEVFQLLASGGRSSIEKDISEKSGGTSAVGREVRDIIKENPTANAFLIFAFLPHRGQVDVLKGLKADLAGAGIDLDQKTDNDKPRFEFLTWGNHEGLNGYEYCDVVIMAGVLHRSHIDMAAAVRGQLMHLREPTSTPDLNDVIESEIAHVIYQGASRGSCRRIDQGKAAPMKLYFMHRNTEMESRLSRVLPDAKWTLVDPKHLRKAEADEKTARLHAQLVAYLHDLPSEVGKQSSREVKKALGIPATEATKRLFSRAVELLEPEVHGWISDARSLVRTTHSFGFLDHSS